MKKLKGEFFIIPNPATEAGELFVKMHKKSIKSFFNRELKVGDKVVQIWCHGEGSDNWSCHGVGDFRVGQFPSNIPLELVENLKEGDTTFFKNSEVEVSLTAKQLSHRYRSFGKFEEALQTTL